MLARVERGWRGQYEPGLRPGRMHPTGAASLPAAPEAEVQAMHSMDWLFKKERIYLLAQFWQQVR